MSLGAGFFARRGPLLAVAGAPVLVLAAPRAESLLAGLPLLVAGLGLRAWAIRWIGGSARTRDPSPPTRWVQGGPYRLRHPLYLANLAVGAGLVAAAAPPGPVAGGFLTLLVAFYAGLALREERARPPGPVPELAGAGLGFAAVARVERSTWMTTGGLLLLLSVLAAIGRG